ncbi:flagellar motor protein MotB [Dyella koreensis]|uniref:OmpA family protein n=1 Tax=Dyella koreensis TaxID=311235 RepID=A0ABW8K874_9GAMM
MSETPAKAGRKQQETIVKKVSRRGHHDDHGGTWKVAFADFCLALLCLFMVLWVLGARDEQETRIKLAISAIYDRSSGIFDGDLPHLERSVVDPLNSQPPPREGELSGPDRLGYESGEELKQLAAEVEKLGRDANLQNNLQAVMTPSGLRVMLHDTHRRGIFELGSALPERRFEELMRRMGELFAKVGNPLLVVGHTDAVPFRDPGMRSNWHLSADRAMAARNSLLKGGMPAERLLQVVGMADRAPLDMADPRAALNRRIEFLLLTRQRARQLVQMFGTPDEVKPLIDGVDAVHTTKAMDAGDV